MPVFPYLIFVDKTNPFCYLRLSTSLKNGLLWSIGVLLVGSIWQFIMLKSHHDKIGSISAISIVGLIIISLFEEILMRGFILNKLSEVTSFPKALLITSLLFVFVHYPGWLLISPGHSFNQILTYSVSIFLIVAMTGGYLVKKSNSLYPSIVLHTVNNFISAL